MVSRREVERVPNGPSAERSLGSCPSVGGGGVATPTTCRGLPGGRTHLDSFRKLGGSCDFADLCVARNCDSSPLHERQAHAPRPSRQALARRVGSTASLDCLLGPVGAPLDSADTLLTTLGGSRHYAPRRIQCPVRFAVSAGIAGGRVGWQGGTAESEKFTQRNERNDIHQDRTRQAKDRGID